MSASINSVEPRMAQARTPAQASPQAAQGALVAFVDLEGDLRQASTSDELRFVVANATRRVVAYDHALVFGFARNRARLSTASDTPFVDRDGSRAAGFEAWATRTLGLATISRPVKDISEPWTVEGPGGRGIYLVLPLRIEEGKVVEALALSRDVDWHAQDLAFLKAVSGAYSHAAEALILKGAVPPVARLGRRLGERVKGLAWMGVAAATIGLAIIPVPMFAYAPAEVVGAEPRLVTASIDGIVADIAVQPGERVIAGQKLLAISDTRLRNEFEIAQRSFDLAQAKYTRMVQLATANRRDLTELSVAKAELSVANAQLALTRDMLSRSELQADADGIVVFGAKSDWIGKPVQTGERIMEIVDPSRTELRIDVSVADVMAATGQASVKLYLDGEPFAPLSAVVERTSYRAQLTPDRILAFRTFAKFISGAPALRIGLRGTARISGPKVPLGYYLFRRPIAALRQRIGI